MHSSARCGLMLVAVSLSLTACSPSPIPLNEYVVGAWECTQTGTTESFDAGFEDGTSWVITLKDDGTGSSQMHGLDGEPVNEEFPLTYAIAGSDLKVSLDHFGKTLTIAGVPSEVENESTAAVSLEGIDWLNGLSTATIKDRTVSGINWDGALFTCTSEK